MLEKINRLYREKLNEGDLFVPYSRAIPPGIISKLNEIDFQYQPIKSNRTDKHMNDMVIDKETIIVYGLAFGKFFRRNEEDKLKLVFKTPRVEDATRVALFRLIEEN